MNRRFRRSPKEITVAVTVTVLLLAAWYAFVYVTVRVARSAWMP